MNIVEALTIIKEYNNDQLRELLYGLKDGLSNEQILAYANINFSHLQMDEIRVGFCNGLKPEQIEMYRDAAFNCYQMEQIRKGFENGLSVDQVKTYANPQFKYDQMRQIRYGFEDGLTVDQVKAYANTNFSDKIMKSLRIGFKYGFDPNLLKNEIKNFNEDQILYICYAIQEGHKDRIYLFDNPNLKSFHMRHIIDAIEYDLSDEQIKCMLADTHHTTVSKMCSLITGIDQTLFEVSFGALSNKNEKETFLEKVESMFQEKEKLKTYLGGFSIKEIDIIDKGYEKGLTVDQVKLCANPQYNYSIINKLMILIESHPEYIDFIDWQKFSLGQIDEIYYGICSGLSKEQILIYANPLMDKTVMKSIRLSLLGKKCYVEIEEIDE